MFLCHHWIIGIVQWRRLFTATPTRWTGSPKDGFSMYSSPWPGWKCPHWQITKMIHLNMYSKHESLNADIKISTGKTPTLLLDFSDEWWTFHVQRSADESLMKHLRIPQPIKIRCKHVCIYAQGGRPHSGEEREFHTIHLLKLQLQNNGKALN